MGNNIPQDPKENLVRMESIMAHWEAKKARLEADRDRRAEKAADAVGFYQAKLLRDVSDIGERLQELEGKMNSLADQIDFCREYIEEEEMRVNGLKHRPFEALQTQEEAEIQREVE